MRESIKNQGTRHYGCFAPLTKIMIENGDEIPILQLMPGELVYNPILKKSFPIKTMIACPEFRPLVKIFTDDNTLIVTEDHPFILSNGEVIQASKLEAQDLLMFANDEPVYVNFTKRIKNQFGGKVYNIELATGNDQRPEAHAVLADGIPSGDLWLQQVIRDGFSFPQLLRVAHY